MLYILNAEGEPVPEPDPIKWAQWVVTAGASRLPTELSVGDITRKARPQVSAAPDRHLSFLAPTWWHACRQVGFSPTYGENTGGGRGV
jgi:hypothetical protein